MALTASSIDAEFEANLADLPDTVTFGGETVACARTYPAAVTLEQLRHSYADAYRASVATRANAWTTAPEQGDTVTYGGTVRRVLATDTSPEDLQLVLHLGDRYHGGL